MKDLYDDVLDFYDAACPLKDRDGFKTALQLTISHDDLEVYFLIPPAGSISLAELRKKSNLPAPVLEARLRNLAFAVLVLVYRLNDDTMYERASSIVMSEQQIRKSQESPQRTFYATFFDGYIEGDMDLMRTQTPHYRVLSAEATIKKESNLRTVEINVTVPDQTRVLPIDIISEMIRQEGGLIGVSQCGCRSAKRVLGTSCDNLLETCFVFNEYAQSLIETGYARKVEYDEAIDILRNCEAHGLVHFSQNCEDRIRSLCNCCSLLLHGAEKHEPGSSERPAAVALCCSGRNDKVQSLRGMRVKMSGRRLVECGWDDRVQTGKVYRLRALCYDLPLRRGENDAPRTERGDSKKL